MTGPCPGGICMIRVGVANLNDEAGYEGESKG